jgi:tetratricopeptide (TPR) repeat protein
MEEVVKYETSNNLSILLEQTKILKIKDEQDYMLACKLKADLQRTRNALFNKWEPLRADAYVAYKRIKKNMEEELRLWDEALSLVNKVLTEYLTEKKEEQEKLQQKLIKEAEEEAKKKQEKLLEKAANAKTEEEAQKILEKAENIYPEPKFIQEYLYPRKVDIPGGGTIGTRENIEVMIINPKTLVQAIANETLPMTFIKEFNIAAIKNYVKATGKKTGIPGVEVKIKVIPINYQKTC